MVVAQRDEEGKQYNYRDDALKLDLKPETYSGMLKTGLVYRQVLKPDAKAVALRVVVRDEAGNLGSVTVPMK